MNSNKSVSYTAARIISTILVPPSFTLLIFIYFALSLETDAAKRAITIVVAFIFGFMLHIMLFLYFRKKGRLINLDATIKEERTVPFLISTIFYFAGLLILIHEDINIISIAFWFCYISNTLIVALINKAWKISVHSMGSAGPAAAVTYIAGASGLLFLFVAAIVGWSRIKLKCHNIYQVAAGIFLGFFSSYLQIYFLVKWFGHGG